MSGLRQSQIRCVDWAEVRLSVHPIEFNAYNIPIQEQLVPGIHLAVWWQKNWCFLGVGITGGLTVRRCIEPFTHTAHCLLDLLHFFWKRPLLSCVFYSPSEIQWWVLVALLSPFRAWASIFNALLVSSVRAVTQGGLQGLVRKWVVRLIQQTLTRF